MSRCRVMALPYDKLIKVLRGERRITNLPDTAIIQAAVDLPGRNMIGLRIHCERYTPTDSSRPKVITAMTETTKDKP